MMLETIHHIRVQSILSIENRITITSIYLEQGNMLIELKYS